MHVPSIGLNQASRCGSHTSILRKKKSIHDFVADIQYDNQNEYNELATRHTNLLENIKTYINVRESNRCSLGLFFEASEANKGMLSESIIKFYLEKVY